MGSVPEKALVLAVTKCMLHREDPLSVGVGLVYKPHYVSTESFCCAYMHLNVWHATASDKDSTDKLDSSHFILVSISETSEVIPDTLLHPFFLMYQTRKPLRRWWSHWPLSHSRVLGSILCAAGHRERSPSVRSLSLASEGISQHPC